jgi:flagellar hook assembly protein FlgD
MVINKPSASLALLASDVNALPTEFSLGNNYPNPFNPTTKFVVAVPKAANVDIVVFDILGRKVRTLMSGETAAGYHTIEWNGLTDDYSPAASGIYFIRMMSGKFSDTKKMMLMK